MSPDERADAGAAALDVRALTGPAGAVVLHDVSFTVAPGGTHVVLGAIHAGKSLLLRLILGLQRAEHGDVAIGGVAFDAARPNDGALRAARRRAGVVFDSSALVARLSLLENVELPIVEHTDASAAETRDAAGAALREAGVVGDLDRTPDDVSRLDRRRAALARAIVLRPAVLLVDEPANGLDPHAAAELDGTLVAVQERYGFACLICSQDVRYAFRAPRAVSVLAGGAVVEAGDLDHLRASRLESVRRLVDRRGVA